MLSTHAELDQARERAERKQEKEKEKYRRHSYFKNVSTIM